AGVNWLNVTDAMPTSSMGALAIDPAQPTTIFAGTGEGNFANHSRYGLAASVWTASPEAARELARSLEVGGVFVNATVRSDPRLPFGGVKLSGHGRELGCHGIREFVNAKTVWRA
ncbi:MAG: aldehyde dehydrogenase family protein, partial [Candidatus Eisenbacteria bacterium]